MIRLKLEVTSLILALHAPGLPIGTPRKIEVAFVAQFYGKDPSREQPKPRVYICGLHGEHRRGIPGICSGREVVWLDSDRLAWLADSTGDSADADRELIHDLRSGTTRTLKIVRGGPIPSYFPHAPDRNRVFHGTTDPNDFLKLSDRKGEGRFGADSSGWYLKMNDETKAFNFNDGRPEGMMVDRASNRIWFYDWGHVSSNGTWMAVYYLDWHTGNPVKVLDNAADFDFSPQRAIYAAVENYRIPNQVNARWPKFAGAWVGNWKTGERWWVARNNAYASSIALRPPR